ncbi:glycosyltransferase family 9 protein [Arachidicoccus sp.]|uniref:glycosyltransferase family 9 protein n=1 Tax=Arachidicoccus sp. TaxID=1872624 RepID=UPI003D207611
MKFLIIRFSSIGDIVLTTPAIRCLRKQYPRAEIHFLTKKKFKAVTIANPYIDKFHYYDDNFSILRRELKAEHFDYIIDLHKNLRTLRLWFSLRTKWLSYQKLSIQKFLLTKLHIDVMPRKHITLRSLETLETLGVVDDGLGLDYFIPVEDEVPWNTLPLTHRDYFGAMVIGASYYTKKLPVDKLIELCDKINAPIILLGGKEDFVEGERIVAGSKSTLVFNACGKFSLNGSADLVKKSSWVISHDTGLQYIACAFQKSVMAVWGGTSPKLAVEPYYGTKKTALFKNFIVPDLPCQPCSNFGTKTCPKKHFKCMKNQDTTSIAQQLAENYSR